MSQEARRMVAASERLDPPPRTNADVPERLRIRRFSEGRRARRPRPLPGPAHRQLRHRPTPCWRPGRPPPSGSGASAAVRITSATTIRSRCTSVASTTRPGEAVAGHPGSGAGPSRTQRPRLDGAARPACCSPRERGRHGRSVRPDEVADQLVGQPELEPDAFGADPAVAVGELPEEQQETVLETVLLRDGQQRGKSPRPKHDPAGDLRHDLGVRRHPRHPCQVEHGEAQGRQHVPGRVERQRGLLPVVARRLEDVARRSGAPRPAGLPCRPAAPACPRRPADPGRRARGRRRRRSPTRRGRGARPAPR